MAPLKGRWSTSALKAALDDLAAASASSGSSLSELGLAVLGPLPSGVLLQGGTGDLCRR